MKSFNKIIYWYAVIALTVPNVALCFTEHLSTWAALANIVLPFGVYMALMSICRKPGKMVWWLFPIIFFAAFQIVLLYLFGKGVIAVDMFLNLVTTNPGEAMELLDNLIPGVASVFILYLPLLILGVVSIRSKKAPVLSSALRKRYALWASALAIVGCIFVATACLSRPSDNSQLDDHHAPHYSVLNDLYPVNVFYNLYLAVKRNNASIHYKEASARFRFDARPSHPEDSCEVYVMVIGETARAMNFSLYGYQRDTNPRLSKTPGLVTFSDVTTQSNTTHKSVPMLLSQASASDFERLFHEKGILQAFREANRPTSGSSSRRATPTRLAVSWPKPRARTATTMTPTCCPSSTGYWPGSARRSLSCSTPMALTSTTWTAIPDRWRISSPTRIARPRRRTVPTSSTPTTTPSATPTLCSVG